MSIKKIARLKRFGVFSDFDGTSLPDFNKFNLFYGWNYSGKTTLSRLFRCLETQSLHSDFPSASFRVISDSQMTFSEANLEASPQVRVFNRDFIEANLKWDGNVEPVLILGEESIAKQTELQLLAQETEAAQAKLQALAEENIKAQSSLSEALTNAAREYSTLVGDRNYNKVKLARVVKSTSEQKQDYSLNLIDFELVKLIALSTEQKEEVQLLSSRVSSLGTLAQRLNALLSTTITAKVIERLVKDLPLSNWIENGLQLHVDKTTCEFCGNVLMPALLGEYNEHFSKDYDEFIESIEAFALDLNQAEIEHPWPAAVMLFPEFQADFTEALSAAQVNVNMYYNELSKCSETLSRKREKPFLPCPAPVIEDCTSAAVSAIEALNAVLAKHNIRVSTFAQSKTEAKWKLEQHFACSVIKGANYVATNAAIASREAQISKVNKDLENLLQKSHDIEEDISEGLKGAELINAFLESHFSRSDLKMLHQNNHFILMRGTSRASNLSEGEKTAIAFTYFLATLSAKGTTLSNTIVFIDDPISSLDSNHLYTTYALIKEEAIKCQQLFISTHNFEFFNLLKDWMGKKDPIRNTREWQNQSHWRPYLISRKRDGSSVIEPPPVVLIAFKSEYHYVYSLLKGFDQTPNDAYEYLFNLPNLARRFLEAFTGFEVPISAGLEKKLEDIVTNAQQREKVMKFLHEYSHQKGLLRSLTFPDFSECEEIVRLILSSTKMYAPRHFVFLDQAITTSLV